jgi:hypothetical protein
MGLSTYRLKRSTEVDMANALASAQARQLIKDQKRRRKELKRRSSSSSGMCMQNKLVLSLFLFHVHKLF